MPEDGPDKKRRLSRVDFRRNRQKPARRKRWEVPAEDDPGVLDAPDRESVRAKGDLSRKRTVIDKSEAAGAGAIPMTRGIVVAARGQYAEVDDGTRIWPCTIRRILRTRRIEERSPVVVGDEVSITLPRADEGVANEAVIEQVHPRKTVLQRSDGRKTQIIAVNVDQVMILASLWEPRLKPHLIDRYLVAAHAGNLPPIICLTKADLAEDEDTEYYLERFRRIGYVALATSTVSGQSLEELRALLHGKATLLSGQSGVGKSSLLNALDPELDLPTAPVSAANEKGRHTTTTARWLRLSFGGAAVDTPGIRALDVAMVPINELEMHFVEFVDRLANCKFPNCVHIHEDGCAIKAAVEAEEIDPSRYESYVQLFMERSESRR